MGSGSSLGSAPGAARQGWIDCVKGLAMLAVVFSHTVTILYQNRGLSNLTVFSVPLLTLMAGVTGWLSLEKRDLKRYDAKLALRGLARLLVPYAVATAVYILAAERSLPPLTLLRHLALFDVVSPFYFIAFYAQLLLVNQLLYLSVTAWRAKPLRLAACFAGVTAAGVLSTLFTHLPLQSAAAHLLGGTFLPLYYLGMLCMAFGWHKKGGQLPVAAAILIIPLFGLYLYYWLSLFNWGPLWGNPPGLTVTVYSLAIFLLAARGFLWLTGRKSRLVQALLCPLRACGRHSLYLFLYHVLFIGIVPNVMARLLALITPAPPAWLALAGNVASYLIIIAIPVAGGMAWQLIKKKARQALAARKAAP